MVMNLYPFSYFSYHLHFMAKSLYTDPHSLHNLLMHNLYMLSLLLGSPSTLASFHSLILSRITTSFIKPNLTSSGRSLSSHILYINLPYSTDDTLITYVSVVPSALFCISSHSGIDWVLNHLLYSWTL